MTIAVVWVFMTDVTPIRKSTKAYPVPVLSPWSNKTGEA